MTTDYQFLLPHPDSDTQSYWDAIKNHELRVPKCSDCGLMRWPPQLTCNQCYGENVDWVKMSGRGTLYTYVIIHQAVLPQWRELTPFNVIQVALEEAPHIQIMGNAVDMDDSELKVGIPMEIVFDDVTPEDTIPRWRRRSE